MVQSYIFLLLNRWTTFNQHTLRWKPLNLCWTEAFFKTQRLKTEMPWRSWHTAKWTSRYSQSWRDYRRSIATNWLVLNRWYYWIHQRLPAKSLRSHYLRILKLLQRFAHSWLICCTILAISFCVSGKEIRNLICIK